MSPQPTIVAVDDLWHSPVKHSFQGEMEFKARCFRLFLIISHSDAALVILFVLLMSLTANRIHALVTALLRIIQTRAC